MSYYNRSNTIGDSGARRQAEIDHLQAKFGEKRLGPHKEFSEILLLGGGGEKDFKIWVEFYFQVIDRLRRLNRKATHSIFLQGYSNMSLKLNKLRMISVMMELSSKKLSFLENYAHFRLKLKCEDLLYADDSEQDRILNRIVEFENKSNVFI